MTIAPFEIENIDFDLFNYSIELTKLPHERTTKQINPELKYKLNILKKYFVGRKDAFVVKYTDKSWYNVKKTLTDDVLIGYVNGEYDLALFPHYQNKKNDKSRNKWRVRWLGIDVDCHGKDFTPENMEKLSESCDILISNCKKFFLFDNPKYIIKERSAHGWHLYIILKKDIIQEKASFYRDITFNNINQFFKERHDFIDFIEYFPFVQMNEKSYGNGLKPLFNKFSDLNEKLIIHELDISFIVKRRQQKYKRYVLDSEKFTHKIGESLLNNITEFPQSCELGKNHKNSLEWFISKYYSGQCIKNIIDGSIQCEGAVGHKMRIKVVNKLKSLGYSEEVIIEHLKISEILTIIRLSEW